MSYVSDFHIHTNCSDGTMSPVEVVRKFKDEKYDMIAITDHDNVKGVHDALVTGEALDMFVIPGIEISAEIEYNGAPAEVHLLGYKIDIENQKLLELCEKLMQMREERNMRIIDKLSEEGYNVSLADLKKEKGGDFIGRPDFVRYFKAHDIDIDDPWGFMESVRRDRVSVQEAIEVVKEAGGIPVLAHPMKIKELKREEEGYFNRLDSVMRTLKKQGLSGIECWHPSANHEETMKLIELAEKYHLHMTNGSDFHEPGDMNKDMEILAKDI